MPVPLLKLCPPAEALTPDADLLARFAAERDEAAFTELVRRHGPVVYRVCRRLVPADALGGGVRTLRRRLDRARAVLRARLAARGVVPAVSATLVAGTGGAIGAVPPDLARQTVAMVFQFLDGAAPATPAVAAAEGVV